MTHACLDRANRGLPAALLLFALLGCDATPAARGARGQTLVVRDRAGSIELQEGSGTGVGSPRCYLAVSSDFSETAAIHAVEVGERAIAATEALTSIATDALVRVVGERVVVLNRYPGSTVQTLDPQRRFATVRVHRLEDGSNPSDVVALPDGRTLLALYGAGRPIDGGELRVVDLEATDEAGFEIERHSLAEWTEADGNPEATRLFVRGDTVFVLLQRLDAYPGCSERGRGAVVALDASTLGPVPRFSGSPMLELAGCNPYAAALDEAGQLWIAEAGAFRWSGSTEDDGGIERVDLESGRTFGLVATESVLGGDVSGVAVQAGTLWATVADAAFSTRVIRGRVGSGGLEAAPTAWSGENVFDIVPAGQGALVADRNAASPAIAWIDAEGTALARVVLPAPAVSFADLGARETCAGLEALRRPD
jgi:hypothetical protein